MKMKKSSYLLISLVLLTLYLTGCIMPFEPVVMSETGGVLVVEGMILNEGTTIKLSRTVSLNNKSSRGNLVYGAHVQVIDDVHNVVAVAEPQIMDGNSVYVVSGEISFTPEVKYALDIQTDGKHYQSAFVSPVRTPEIDEISWRQNPDGSMDIMVTTHDPDSQTEYYRWAFEEDWEIRSELFGTFRYEPETREIIEQSISTANNRFYCWESKKSNTIILGSSEQLTGTTIKDKVIHNFHDRNTRFSYLYSILVKQYGLDKGAYTYFDNLRKNIELSGSLFAPQLTETYGNITCLTNPDEMVIGYITASNSVMTRLYIDMTLENLYLEGEDLHNCGETRNYAPSQLDNLYRYGYGIVTYEDFYYVCAPVRCVDCTSRGGTKNKPDFWPNDHQ